MAALTGSPGFPLLSRFENLSLGPHSYPLPGYDDAHDYTYPTQRSGVCIEQTQYKVPPLRPVLGILSPREENPFQVDTVR